MCNTQGEVLTVNGQLALVALLVPAQVVRWPYGCVQGNVVERHILDHMFVQSAADGSRQRFSDHSYSRIHRVMAVLRVKYGIHDIVFPLDVQRFDAIEQAKDTVPSSTHRVRQACHYFDEHSGTEREKLWDHA